MQATIHASIPGSATDFTARRPADGMSPCGRFCCRNPLKLAATGSTAATLRMDDRPASGIRRTTWYLSIPANGLAALALRQIVPMFRFITQRKRLSRGAWRDRGNVDRLSRRAEAIRSCDAPRVSSPCQRLPAVRVRLALCLRGPDRTIHRIAGPSKRPTARSVGKVQ